MTRRLNVDAMLFKRHVPTWICCGYLLEAPRFEKSALSRAMYINGAGGRGGGGGERGEGR